MPHRIIDWRIVAPVKPYELIAALMERQGLGPLPLAKRLGRPDLQPQIHRFVKGQVKSPSPNTVAPIAAYFEIPLEAMYDERTATSIARSLGLDENKSTLPLTSVNPVAQTVNLDKITVPSLIEWGELMTERKLPPEFEVRAPDDAMAPRVRTGEKVKFDSTLEPRAADGVLVRDASGNVYFRQYRVRRPGEWEAYALNEAYRPLDSVRDGLTVLAVVVGVDSRWG